MTEYERRRDEAEVSGWALGGVGFAATMMVVIGLFQVIAGLTAIFDDEFYVITQNYTFDLDVTAWGWIHLLLGIGLAVVGYFLFVGATWARWTAIVLVGISMFANFMWLPYYPLWALIIIALDVAVVWAISTGD